MPNAQSPISGKLWSLAALYASVIIGWIAYQNYQPRLLTQFEFTDFTLALMIVQGVIVVVTPLVAGMIGDRYRRTQGHRLPIISTGISLAAMTFMAVAFTLLGNPGEVFKWVLPILIVLWLVAMSIFTSPALSTVELFAPVDKLPYAMAVLTITANLMYAMEPVIVDIIDYLGAPITFVAGGVAVFLSGYALRKNSLDLFKERGERETTDEQDIIHSPFGFIFFMGLSVGISTTVLFYGFPDILAERLGAGLNLDGPGIVVGVLLLCAIISWPASGFVSRLGMERVFWMSMTTTAIAILAVWLSTSPVITVLLLVVFAVGYTALSVASLPLAINRSASARKVFGVGVFFSGVAMPEGLWEAWLAAQ